jgi:hypothetical protein
MRCRFCCLMVLIMSVPARSADHELKDLLDFTARPRLIDTHFARYGAQFTRNVSRELGGIRIRLPATAKAGHTGLYSYFAVAGNFEMTADFELIDLPKPETGYGSAVGIALDADRVATGGISLCRGRHPKEGSAFWVTRATPSDSGTKYESKFFSAEKIRGKFGFRREKDAIICLASDGLNEPMKELERVPFTAGTLRPLRVYADNGGSSLPVDVKVVNLILQAEEVTGGIPEIGRESYAWIVGLVISTSVITALSVFFWRARRRRRT